MRYLSLVGVMTMTFAMPAGGPHAPAHTGVHAFMKLKLKNQGQLTGESTKLAHEKTFELRAFAASPNGTFTLTADIGGSPLFLPALSSNDPILLCEIEFEKADPAGKQAMFEHLRIANARISTVLLVAGPQTEPGVELTLTTAGGTVEFTDAHGAVSTATIPPIDATGSSHPQINIRGDFWVSGAQLKDATTKKYAEFAVEGLHWTISAGSVPQFGLLSFSMPVGASTDEITQAAKVGASLNKTKLVVHRHDMVGQDRPYLEIDLSDATVAGDPAHSSPVKTGAPAQLTVAVKHAGISKIGGKVALDVW